MEVVETIGLVLAIFVMLMGIALFVYALHGILHDTEEL